MSDELKYQIIPTADLANYENIYLERKSFDDQECIIEFIQSDSFRGVLMSKDQAYQYMLDNRDNWIDDSLPV